MNSHLLKPFNTMKRIVISIISIFFMATAPVAQPLLTVEEAVAAVLKNNFDILLLRNDSAVFALNNSYANAAFLPRLNATSGIVFNNNNTRQKLADGSERGSNGLRSNNINSALNLNWTIFDGLKMFATREKLEEFVRLGSLNIQNQLTTSVAEAIITYYNIVRQKQQLRAIEEQMQVNEERVTQAEKKISVGLGAKPELLQAQLDLNAQKASRLDQLNLIEQLKEQLNLVAGFAPGTSYDVADSIPLNTGLIAGEIFSTAEDLNPGIQVAKQNIRIAELTLRERRAERFPTVSFNAAYNFSRTSNQAVVNNFTPLFNRNFGFNYGFTATIPIFNGFNVRRQIQEAKLDVSYQQVVYDYERFRVNIGISRAFKDYEARKSTLALEEENIKLAKENVYIALERFRLGLSTSLELRETQRSLEDAYNRLIAARYNLKVAETELLRLKGDLVK